VLKEAPMRVVVCISGQGLAQRGLEADTPTERRYVSEVAGLLADIADCHQLLVTHGDQPHLDFLLSDGAGDGLSPQFDIVNAESQGAVGYLLAQDLQNALLPKRRVAALLVQVLVAPDDEAFSHPSALVGPRFGEKRARQLAARLHWSFRPDAGGWRRVVPEPCPLAVVEAVTIEALLSAGVVVVCGAAGIPVVSDGDGVQRGVAAVVSPELCSGLLAQEVDADRLVFLLDTSDPSDAASAGLTVADPTTLTAPQHGDVRGRQRLEAARRFVSSARGDVCIGPLRQARAVVHGDVGLIIRPRVGQRSS
jgi:carbamate kinase